LAGITKPVKLLYRKDIVKNLELLFQSCIREEQQLLVKKKLKQNDARITFYKHLINTINSTIHLVVFSDTHLFEENWWENPLPKYNISQRFFAQKYIDSREKEIDYIDEHIMTSYFIFIFHTFEHSFKIICKKYFPDDYYQTNNKGEKRIRNFKNLFDITIPKFNLWNDERQRFIEIVVKFRNIIHANGVYTNDKGKSSTYSWNNNKYSFIHGQQIEVKDSDLWTEYTRFSKEFIKIFDGIVISIGEQYIEDITEPK
jgi:hypothetical protein